MIVSIEFWLKSTGAAAQQGQFGLPFPRPSPIPAHLLTLLDGVLAGPS